MLGRKFRRIFILFFQFDEYGVLTYLHNLFYRYKYVLTGKFEALTARNEEAEQGVFRKAERNVANFAEMFSVR